MRKMSWDGNVYSEEVKRVQKLSKPGTSSARCTPARADRFDQPAEKRRRPASGGNAWLQPEQPESESGAWSQPERAQIIQKAVPKPEHTVIRTGSDARQTAEEKDVCPPRQPVKKPEHTVVRKGSNAQQESAVSQEPRPENLPLPPSVLDGDERQKIPEAMYDGGVPVPIHIKSYRGRRSGRGIGGDELLSPVNILCALITVAALVLIALNWKTVTTALVNCVIFVVLNLGTLLMLAAGIAVLVFLVRGRRGRRGLFRFR